jgi:hypothetical protein
LAEQYAAILACGEEVSPFSDGDKWFQKTIQPYTVQNDTDGFYSLRGGDIRTLDVNRCRIRLYVAAPRPCLT